MSRIIADYSEYHTEHKSELCGQYIMFLNAKPLVHCVTYRKTFVRSYVSGGVSTFLQGTVFEGDFIA